MTTERPALSRRRFLQRSVAAAGATLACPRIVPQAVLGRDDAVAPSNRLALGFIGLGWKGFEGCWGSLLQSFIREADTQVLAVCDVDRRYRERAQAYVNEFNGNQDCAAYQDFRDLLVRPDLDAVVIATPDHWHAVMTIWACRHGKDVYCEKPLSLTIREARAMVDAARRFGRVVQTGSQSRSLGRLKYACEVARSGQIGKVLEVHASCGGPSIPCALPGEPVPRELDWDRWLGPAPWRPYHSGIHPVNFRAWYDYSGGGMTDWGAHHFDLVQWGLGRDHTGPVEIIPPDGGEHRWLTYQYADGVKLYHSNFDIGGGVTFVGTEGKVWMFGLGADTKFEPAHLARMPRATETQKIDGNQDHTRNFLECVRTRSRPNADVEIGCRSATVCHLGNLAYQLKRPLQWDPDREEFVNDPEANRFLDRAHREPWDL